MTKLRKQRRRKKYDYGRNRKRVRKQQEKATKYNVKVDCQAMRDSWDNRISVKENMDKMGIVLSAAEMMPIKGAKKNMVDKMKKQRNIPVEDETVQDVTSNQVARPEVLEKLHQEANVPAKQTFRFSTTQVQLITYMMDKYGTDYKAMSRDPRNHYQETPAKLRGMITKFISIPEHYAPYCKERGLLGKSEDEVEEIV